MSKKWTKKEEDVIKVLLRESILEDVINIFRKRSEKAIKNKASKLKPKKVDKKSNSYGHIKTGVRKDVDSEISFRSGWETNFARVLKHKGIPWEFEPKTFIFSHAKRGKVSYTPDFLVDTGEEKLWIEVKGRMNPGDYTKLLNFKREYPDEFEKLRGVVRKNSKAHKSFQRLKMPIYMFYDEMAKEYKDKIKNWEGR